MFSPDHFIWIGIVIIVVLLLTFLSVKFKWDFKTATTIVLVIYVLAEVFKICTHIAIGFCPCGNTVLTRRTAFITTFG